MCVLRDAHVVIDGTFHGCVAIWGCVCVAVDADADADADGY